MDHGGDLEMPLPLLLDTLFLLHDRYFMFHDEISGLHTNKSCHGQQRALGEPEGGRYQVHGLD